jgi:hypothetical protein
VTETVEMLRLTQVALLVVTLVVLGARVGKWWCSRWRCLLPAAGTGVIALLICVGTVDALLNARPGGVQTFALTAASVGLLMQALTVGMGRGGSHTHGGVMDIQPRRSERTRGDHWTGTFRTGRSTRR